MVKVGLYYFSATGNSLTTAQYIAKELPYDCELISFASLKDKDNIQVNYEMVGFVFPIYYGDMPYLVRYIIHKMIFLNVNYIFAFSTYRGHSGDIAKRLDNLLHEKEQSLSLSIGISMPGNSYLSTQEQIINCLKSQKQNIKQLMAQIINQEKRDYSSLTDPEISPIAKGFYNMRGIQSDGKCIGCGLCTQVCPMNNIQLKNKRAFIGDKCITCLTCFHWCPCEAIHMSKEKDIEYRPKYHHPDICITDIINQKK